MKEPDSPRRTATAAAELEAEFAELGGWEAETRRPASCCSGLGLDADAILYTEMKTPR